MRSNICVQIWLPKNLISLMLTQRLTHNIVKYNSQGQKNKQRNGEVSSGGWPIVGQASPTRWLFYKLSSISVSAHMVVRGCIWLLWNFFGDYVNTFAHCMMSDCRGHLPTPHWVFSSLWATRPVHPILPQGSFYFFPWMKKSSKGNVLPMWKRGNNRSRSTKRNHNRWVQNFEH